MARLEQSSIRYQNEQRRQQIDSLRNDRGSVMAANASQETLGWANFIAEATPTGAKLWQQQQENARFNAQLKLFEEESNLTIATGADLAASEKFKHRQLDAYQTRGAFADALAAGYPMEQAEKLDAGASGMERDEILAQAINQVKSKAPAFIQDQIRNSGLILKDEDGNLIDVSSRTLDPAVHAGVVKFFRQKYQQANLGSPDKLGKDRWRKYKIKDDFQKIENDINSNHINIVNQAKEFERIKGLKRHINLKLKDGEEINYDYVLDTILTFTDNKGKPLDYKGAHDWLTKYVKDLAKVDSVNAQKLVTAMENGTYTGPSGGQVRFGTLRIDDMQETVIKERDDNLTTKIKADQGVAIDAAIEYLSSDRGPEARQKVIDLAKKHNFNPKLVFAAEHEANLADPVLEAKLLNMRHDNGEAISPDETVNDENRELLDKLSTSSKQIAGFKQSDEYKNIEKVITGKMLLASEMTGVGVYVKTEATQTEFQAKKHLEELTILYSRGTTYEQGFKEASKEVLKNLDNITDLESLKTNMYYLMSQAGADKTTRGTLNKSWVFLRNNASTFIGNSEKEAEMKDILLKLPVKTLNDITNYGEGRGGAAPSELTFMYHRYSRNHFGSRKRDKLSLTEFAKELDRISVGGTEVKTTTDKSSINPEDDLIKKASDEEESLVSAIDKRYTYPTYGSLANVGLEAKRIKDPFGQITENLASYITVS